MSDERVVRLSKRTVDAAAPEARRFTVWDSELKGFGLVVQPSGIKSYIVRYRVGGGRTGTLKQMVLGRHGAVTPEEARSLARKALAAVARGDDPAGLKIQAREAPTLEQIAQAFLNEHTRAKRKASTAVHYAGLLNTYVLPALGRKRAAEVTATDLARLHLSLANKPYQANRMLATMGSLYSFAQRQGLVPEGYNPAKKVDRYTESRRERFLTVEELQRLGEALTRGVDPGFTSADGQRERISPYAAAALRLLLFTGCRVAEVLSLRWEYVDVQRGLLFLPDSKTGRKTIVLNAPALAVLADIPRAADNPYVICGQKPGAPITDLKRPWQRVLAEARLRGVRLHDLRHTFASYGAGASFGLPILGKLLGHTQAATTARYAHLDADPLRRASEQISNTIAAALKGANAS
jgi:integrase